MTAQSDYIILNSGKSEVFVQIKLTKNMSNGDALNCAALECHWNTQLRWLQCRGISSSAVRAKQF